LRDALVRLIRNPMVLGLLAGLLASLLNLQLPSPVLRTVDMFASSCSALSLFVIGGSLVGLPLRGQATRVAPIVSGKLLIHPLCVALVSAAVCLVPALHIDNTLRAAAVLFAAMPMLSIYPTLAQKYGLSEVSALALLLTVITSFFTLTAWLWLYHSGLLFG
jgi:malonate transporter and related proteins